MVIASRRAKIKWVIAIHIPPKINQIRFMKVANRLVAFFSDVMFLLNGHSAIVDNLNTWMPKGIPTMVMQRITPAIRYSTKTIKPPKMSHTKFPKVFISFIF